MRTGYTVTTPRPTAPPRRLEAHLGLACTASGVMGIAVGAVTLSYPAAVASDRWSYPFGATAQWIVSVVLAVTHLLTLAGFIGVIAARPHGQSRAAGFGLRAAVLGYAGLAVCEVLSGAVGTQHQDSSAANALGNAFGLASLIGAIGSIVAGVAIARRHGLRSGWAMILWSGIITVVLVTPANISDNDDFSVVALMLWSLTLIPLGRTLIRTRVVPRSVEPAQAEASVSQARQR